MMKLTVLYKHPASQTDFEKYDLGNFATGGVEVLIGEVTEMAF